MEKKQTVLPSAHLLEIFMPYRSDEARMLSVFDKALELDFYRGVELGIFFDKANRAHLREKTEKNNINLVTFITPYVKDKKMSLCTLDSAARKEAVSYVLQLVEMAAEQGCRTIGIPSGDYPGDAHKEEAKKCLAESVHEIANKAKSLSCNLTIEPLDRYAHKKQLIGPMGEAAHWVGVLRESCDNFFIHWDSAHEALGGIDLMESLELASPYLAQFHICNAVTDKNHPYYGDWHMDVGTAPDFETEGFLSPSIGAGIIKKAESFEKPKGVENVYVSIEVLGHIGDDLWLKEKNAREFLQKCLSLAR